MAGNESSEGSRPSDAQLLFSALRTGRKMLSTWRSDTVGGLLDGWLNERQSLLESRALELWHAGRLDRGAVNELRRLAGDHMSDLERTARSKSRNNRHLESRESNGVWRLLQAAFLDRDAEPLTPEIEQRIEQIEAFQALELADQFALLKDREPRLAELEDEVRRSPLRPPRREELSSLPKNEALSQALRWWDLRVGIQDRISQLVGTTAHRGDPVLDSDVAKIVVSLYFQQMGSEAGDHEPPSST